MKLSERAFTSADQERFAALSGDHNPMHMDPLQARRTQAGAPVVHGIHLLLWALESLAASESGLQPVRGIRVQFSKFIFLHESVEVVLARRGPTEARLVLSVDGAPRSKATITFGKDLKECPEWSPSSSEPISLSSTPSNLSLEEMSGRSGCLSPCMTAEGAVEMFPLASAWLGVRRIRAIAATSHLVGMICPGLHSIYSDLQVAFCTETETSDSLAFRVTEIDTRFRSIEQEVAGCGITGVIKGFARNPPASQATIQSLSGLVSPGEFAGSFAVVIGGSRGLGELTAKLIASGGGRVVVTWQTGKDDAERVAQEIRSAGGDCETFRYDVCEPAANQLAGLTQEPTHLYYFATPAIFRPQSTIFNRERLNEFLAVYVDGFWDLTRALGARRPGISIFYPSSVSVTERPQGMTDYTMAKAAGEVLCADMNAAMAPAHVTVIRLPRLPTDQTASVTSVETADPVDVMLPIVREVQSWPR